MAEKFLKTDCSNGAENYSASFSKVQRHVVNSQGVALFDFMKTLKPDYFAVYRDIGLGYIFLLGTLACVIFAEVFGAPRIIVALVGAVSVGYWIAYLQLFIHEGAHWNLASCYPIGDYFPLAKRLSLRRGADAPLSTWQGARRVEIFSALADRHS
jgi:hypothetical protein